VAALLFVTIAHRINHIDISTPKAPSALSYSLSSDTPDSEKKTTAGAFEYCHACSPIALLTAAIAADKSKTGFHEEQRPHILVAIDPKYDNPPPVRLI
jgi:hypothetical protein